MENLRWILIFAGVSILALLYFTGRKSPSGAGRTRPAQTRRDDHEDLVGGADPLLGQPGSYQITDDPSLDGFGDVDPEDFERPAATRNSLDYESEHFQGPEDDYLPPELQADEPRRPASLGTTAAGALGGLSQKIDAIGARLSGKRRERIAASTPDDASAHEEAPVYASKIITLHVVARNDGELDGPSLLQVFEQRGYVFGDMNIFHSMHHDKTVFSVAKMVEPGWFDPQDINSFTTPGITLILQLPGPVAADTAFEVLLSEAHEIAVELGGTVLDGDRSTLSKQTAQHMREGVYEYMHRQKYFGSVAS